MGKTKRVYKLGCRKDPKDFRDIPMGLVLPPIPLPKRMNYLSRMTPVRNQGNEGTCVAFASVVGVKEYQDTLEYKKLQELSPRFVYSLCKKLDGIPDEEGTYPRIAMKVLLDNGVCRERFWPYQPHQADKPEQGADKDARKYRIKAYARLDGILEMKRSLVVNGPFMAGVAVYESWFTPQAEKTGLIPMPGKNEYRQGGHAVCIAGYDDTKKLFTFKNSWGEDWGNKGYGYLKYAYMEKFCLDAWSGTDLIDDPQALVKAREEILRKYA